MRSAFLFLLISFFMASPAFASSPLRIAVEKDYPPLSFYNQQGELTGFDVDVALALCKLMQRECELIPFKFEEVMPALIEGRVDVAVASLGETTEREKQVLFTQPYYKTRSIFIKKTKHTSDHTPLGEIDFKGLRLSAKTSSLQLMLLGERYGHIATIIAASDIDEVLGLVQKGQADFALVDALAGYDYLKQPKGDGLESVGEPVAFLTIGASIAVNKDKAELRDELDKALSELLRLGEYKKITFRYFDFPVF